MAITRAKQSSLKTGVTKYDNLRAGLPYTPTIGTATDGGTGTTVSVAFTGNNTAGLTYTALSTPGSLSATGTTSPITVTGLTSGTAYTFAVKATNSAGDSPYSAASNSVTPATPPSFESIATFTGNGTASSYTFSSIPSTYKSLQIRAISRTNQAAEIDDFAIQFNSDTGSNYVRHLLYGTGSVAEANQQTAQSRIVMGRGTGSSAAANMFGVSITDIHDYASTTKNKTTRTINGYDLNGTGLIYLQSGLWLSTSAVTSITLFSTSTSNFQTGTTFALYGIK